LILINFTITFVDKYNSSHLMKTKNLALLLFITFLLSSCASHYYERNNFKYPEPVDTQNKKIDFQDKKTYQIGHIFADNQFDGARLNGFKQINDSTYLVNISPENTPINTSPWYAFKIWSDTVQQIYLQLHYTYGKHRYLPKISSDRKYWKKIDAEKLILNKDKTTATFPLLIKKDTTWVAGEEIINTSDIQDWINSLKANPLTHNFTTAGTSVLGKNIPFFRIGKDESTGKKAIVLMSRQHPPEISGFIAFQRFIEAILQSDKNTDRFFNEYDIWVFPVLNPDGVDLGHWRHNARGVDLNRDWAYYRQPETDAVTKFIVNQAKKHQNKVVLGIDFHSTYKDIYYTYDQSFHTNLSDFTPKWIASIDRAVAPFKTKTSPEALSKAFSKTWFYKQFKAESITYEVGDETPREFIKRKAEIAARNMIKFLLEDM